jgi:large conductance mechanosensitive channel
LSLAIGDNQLYYGPVLTAVIGFIILAAVVYFLIVKPYEAASARFKKDDAVEVVAVDESVELLKEIRDALRARG